MHPRYGPRRPIFSSEAPTGTAPARRTGGNITHTDRFRAYILCIHELGEIKRRIGAWRSTSRLSIFDLPGIPTEIMNRWKNDIAVERVKDVINESTKDIFTDETMKDWVDTKAPPRVQRTPKR